MSRQASTDAQVPKQFGLVDCLKITVLGFALTALWSSLQSIILPIRLLEFVNESQKNTYLGLLTFIGMIVAMVIQPGVGTISDRTRSSWGRRRPYILFGSVLAVAFLPGIGLAGSYTSILIVYCLLQISCNTAQAAYQAFIPEFLPENKRGLASGLKSLLEILGGVALVRLTAYLMGNYFGGEGKVWLWMALSALMVTLLAALVITVTTVKEKPSTSSVRLSAAAFYKSFNVDFKAHRDFGWFLIARALLGMPGVMLQTFVLYYLMDVVGIANPAAVTGNLLVVVGICLLVAAYPAGRLSDRLGRQPIVIASSLLGAVGVVVLFLSHNYSQIMLSGALIGVANGALLSSSWALATDFAVKGEEARYLGVTNLAMVCGSALARLVGPLIDVLNRVSPGLGYQTMLLICFVCFVAGALLVVKIRGYKALG